MSAIFDATALSTRYARLDELPECLFAPTLVNPAGQLHERVSGLLHWRAALLAGELPRPEDASWPSAAFFTPLAAELGRLELPRFCRGESELTDAVLVSVLDAVARGAAHLAQRTRELADDLRREEEARRQAERSLRGELEAKWRKSGKNKGARKVGAASERVGSGAPAAADADADDLQGDGGADAPPQLDEDTLRKLRVAAERLAHDELAELLSAQIHREWEERARLWCELSEVFGELSQLLGLGWDLTHGVLRSQGWLEVMRLHELLKQLPALRQLVQMLGRMQSSQPDTPAVMEQIFVNVRRAALELRQVHSPLVPMETRGIERSGELARMLPSEAALLGHPVLKLLWHARRAERGLMSYRVEGTDWERTKTETEGQEARQGPQRPQQRGPILLCVDTSGSMAGLPEQVAKALALEAVRTAYAEKRRLYVYLFSGPAQVAEQELMLSRDGLVPLMKLLTMSFHGGTDVSAPLLRAVRRLEEPAWSHADILLVSDGEFSVPSEALKQIALARAQCGLRLHGILIGGGSVAAMDVLCDSGFLHRFTDWADLGRMRPAVP